LNTHYPTEGIPTLMWWWDLRGKMTLRVMPAVV